MEGLNDTAYYQCGWLKYNIQTLCHIDSNSIKIEVYSNEKTHRLFKFLLFIYKCAGILPTSICITQWVLATPTLMARDSMNIINIMNIINV